MTILHKNTIQGYLRAGLAAMTVCCTACSERPDRYIEEVDPPSGPELRLSPVFTRVAGDCFEIGDKVGVFMFYPEADDGETDGGGDGPYIDNKEFTCRSGSGGGLVWDCGETLRWKDGSTPADFICYHPYSGDAAGKDVLQCRVMSSQSSSKALSDSDILWGSRSSVSPTSDYVELMASHRTGQVIIELVPGKGYDNESLLAAVEGIVLKGAVCSAVLDLRTGELSAAEAESEDIVPFREGLTCRALIPPQIIDTFTICISVAGMDRSLATSVEIVPGCRAHCTITVNKVSDGMNIGIDGWTDADGDFGGILN